MKRFQSILCTSLLTLTMSSAAFAGNISGNSINSPGNISGLNSPGNISGLNSAGNISGLSNELYKDLVGFLTVLIS